jgi:hypothetical protein
MSHGPAAFVVERHFDPKDQAADPYPLIPFDLPPGVGRLDVRYTYSDPISPDPFETQPGNVVDLGVLAPDGFRGWSGSARQSFVLTPDRATPGYLPGPLVAGRWHILLGLYKLAPAGCDVRAEIRWALEDSGAALTASYLSSWDGLFERVARRGAGWYRGDLHSHSHHSEAQGTLHDLLAAAQAQRLDFLAITEHNTVSHLVEMAGWLEPPSPLIIPAMELTTYHGHANALGIRRWHDFRRCTPDQMAALRAEVQAESALFVVNHPKITGPPWEWGSEAQADAVEVWQQPWHVFNYQSLTVWDQLLKQGHRLTAVGGSDKHQAPFDGSLGFHEVGQPCTWVYAEELSVPALLAGLRAGHAFISAGPAGPRLELTAAVAGSTAMMGDTLPLRDGQEAHLCCRVTGADGLFLLLVSAASALLIPIDGDDWSYGQPVTAGDGYCRAQVIEPPPAHQRDEPAAHMAVALANPIYLT